MSTKTLFKTVVMTTSFAALCGVGGWLISSVWFKTAQLDPHMGIFVSAVTFLLSPLLIFPLVRKTHLLVRAYRDLEILASTDTLTGVPNRRRFFEAAEAIFEAGLDGSLVAAVMLDIDEFKALNDKHGHAAGDVVLKAVAMCLGDRLTTAVDHPLSFGRIGGEEFAIVLTGKSAHEATCLAQELVEAVRSLPIDRNGETFAVTISAGTAVQALPYCLDQLISEADAALYAAKSVGRDRVFAADNKVRDKALGRVAA
ncbi:MAG: GGDEF domain-containing protein [Rhizobium rhizophilum]